MLDADLEAAMLVEPAGFAGHRPGALHGHAVLVVSDVGGIPTYPGLGGYITGTMVMNIVKPSTVLNYWGIENYWRKLYGFN